MRVRETAAQPHPELTACPFCGHVPHLKDHIRIEGDSVEYAVNCRECGAAGPRGATHPDAVALWEMRASDVQVPEAVRP